MLSGTIFGQSVVVTGDEETKFKDACANYIKLQDVCMELSEDDIMKCIVIEKRNRNRANILTRLYSRYSNLRSRREKLELCS